MAIEVVKLDEPMLAEVRGVDLTKPVPEEARRAIYRAFLDNLVLVFRDQTLPAGQVVEVGRLFGDLQPHITKKYWHPDYNELIVMTNLNKEGQIDQLDSKRGVGWHTDMCYMEVPAKATMLHTIRIPEVGGDTLFLNLYMAHDDMPQALRKRLEGLKATFRYGGRHTEDAKRLTDEDRARPPVAHPILRYVEDSGRTSIYCNPYHTIGIEGWEEAAADDLLGEVYEWCRQERFQARHRWRQGDTVIWDNRCCWHSATGDNPLRQPREFYRATVSGTVPIAAH